ncbi:peptidoglycan DD-metalloendopeptidase family protein [Staphylococcus nepalensis]|nr:peptidoglycan DD-metalloendopeptidase family protein [Staphylococcus nepalensis]
MMQVAKGRADELGDELDELKRKQHGLILSTKLMGAGWKGARGSMDRMATTLRSLGELTQGVVGGVMTTHFSALVPILGSVVSLGAGLGGMLTAAAGGAIGMGGAFGIAGVAVKAFAGQATYALKMLEDGQLRVTKEVSAYQTALSGLKTSWEDLIAQNQAAIFNTMTNGINTAKYALTTLNPFLTKTASQIETASGKMLNWAKTSSVAKRSFDILNTQGPKIFQHLLNATQSFVNGSAALFNKLSPLYGWAAKGFADMAKSFDNWANSVQGSKAINGFVEYTKANLPIVGSIFGNIFSGIISLFQAFSGHSHNVLLGIQDVTKGFAEWSEGLKKSDGFQQFVQYLETNGPKVWSLIKNITGTLWGLVKGMAPVGAAVLSVSNAFFKWTNEMTNAHPMIGKILGYMTAIAGIGLLAAKPFFMVGGALISMRRALLAVTGAEMLFGKAGAFATLQTNRQRLATKLLGNEGLLASAKMKIAAAATKTWSLVTKGASLAARGLGLAIRFMTGPIGLVITAVGLLVAGIMHLWNTNATFRNAVINIWNSIKAAAISVFGFLKPYIVGIWNGIKTASILVWNILKSAAISTWNGIKFAVQNPIQALRNILSAIWNGIKVSAIWIWNTLKTGVVNIVKALVNGVKWYINTVKTVISTVFNAAKAIAIRIWTTIKNTVVNLAKGLWLGVKNTFTWLKNSVVAIFNSIKNFAIKVWTILKNTVISRAKTLWTGVKNIFTWLKNSVVSIFNAVKNFAVKIWTSIKNTVISRAKALWNGVKSAWNALKTGTIKIMAAVAAWLIKKWTSIKNSVVNRVKALWTGVKNTWNTLKGGTTKIISAVSTWLSKKWTAIKNSVVNKAKALWSGVKGAWNNLKKGTTNTFKAVGSFMSSKWNSIKSGTVNKAKATWSGIKGAWGSLSKGTRNTMNSVGGFMSKKWRGIKNSTVNLVTGMKNKITGVINKMGDVIKSVTGKIKGFFSGMIGKVKSGLNKLIGGVNWVGKKLDMKPLPEIKLHTGTEHTNTTTNVVKNGKIARDTFATVGDKGRGNGPNGFRHEAIRYPNGKMALTPNKDTTAFLPQGSTVYNGAQTHSMLSNSNPTFSKGTLPRFHNGTKKKKDENLWDKTKNVAGEFGEGISNAAHGVKENTQKALEASAKAVGKGKDWLKDKVGDVMDWVKNPGKLLNHILDAFGVNMEAFGIGKGSPLPFDMMKGMFGKLKDAAKSLITSWLEEAQGGEGDAAWLLKHPIWQKFGSYTGGLGFNGGKHYGVDFGMKPGTDVKAVAGGKVSKVWNDYGGGKSIEVDIGKGLTNWYMHLSKQLVSKGDKVGVGDLIAKSGNTGNFTAGSGHLHFQLNKKGKPQSNVLEWLKGLGGGGKKSPSKWKSTIKKAAKKMKVNLSGSELNGIVAQIARESNGDAGVTQGNIGDINNLRGTPAQGLLQYVPSTFKAYAMKGHTNIKSGYDQLLAFFNNKNWRKDLPNGKSGWGPSGGRRYAVGTNNARRGFNQVFEKGGEIMQMRGGETVIPNDVSIQAFKQIATSDIFSRTQSAVYDAISQYADQLREKQQMATREQMELQRINRENADIKEQNSILRESLDTMKAILGELTNVRTSNEQIRDKEYFPSSREMTKMNNENMALNAATQLMR